MKITIQRFNPDTNKKWLDTFEVPLEDRVMTVMNVLDYISLNLDPSLSYYRHSVCDHGVCGRCSLSVNGKVRLACLEIANNHKELLLGPVPNRTLIKDLVTQQTK